jgi:hypothetical protein
MSTETLSRIVVLKVMECGTCGIAFAMPQSLYDHCFKEGGFWHCPMGHMRGWEEGQKARDEKDLKQQLARAAKRLEEAETQTREWREWGEQQDRRLSAAKGQMTKLKKRVHNGACPVCNRHFTNLERHMHGQHPDFAEIAEKK